MIKTKKKNTQLRLLDFVIDDFTQSDCYNPQLIP